MGIFDGTQLDPSADPTTDVWPSTLAELKARRIDVHGSLSKGHIGDGATAIVLKGTETDTGRVVAIKVYRDPDQQVRHRNGDTVPMSNFFENERRTLADLQHCSPVPRYHYSVEPAAALTGHPIQPFHVMEFIEGRRVTAFARESLESTSRGGTDQILDLFQQVLQTVEAVHQVGYLHRDISDGNVLVDKQGRIRLIDLAEGSPLGADHTRLVSTPGQGTDGVSSPAQQQVRAIQTDDVNALCTIGYALFTGRWKQQGEIPSHWRARLIKSGCPSPVADILAKGMTPRDVNRKHDPAVWNTAREVDAAIQAYRDQRTGRRRFVRRCTRLALAAAFIAIVVGIGWWQVQSQAYYWSLNQLERARTELASQPFLPDPRVQQHVEAADKLESDAEVARAAGRPAEAVRQLQQAVAELRAADGVADMLERVSPLLEPLQAIRDNVRWNTKCRAINERLTALRKDYLAVKADVDSGDPEHAWQAVSHLQTDLVKLMEDNQASREVAELFQQFDATTAGMASELTDMSGYKRILGQRDSAFKAYYQTGSWPEARTSVLAQQQALDAFLEINEDDKQWAARLAANADRLNEQLAKNQSLQRQVKSLNDQLEEAREDLATLDKKNNDILIAAAKDRNERQQATATLANAKTELNELQATLQTNEAKLKELTANADRLAKKSEVDRVQLAELQGRVSRGTTAYQEQGKRLAKVEADLQRSQQLVERLKSNPGVDADAAERMVRLASAEAAIKEFNPDTWDEANDRLTKEAAAYETLVRKRQTERAKGKTARHDDVMDLDTQLASQFRIVVEALKKRNEADREAWLSLESRVAARQTQRQAKIDEGWDLESGEVTGFDDEIATLRNQQRPYIDGKDRHDRDEYNFADWDSLSQLPDGKYTGARAAFGKLEQGTKFTNSVGQVFVYIPPGSFMMGSPSNEEGRDDDEKQHRVELSQGFFMAIHETTQGQYETVAGGTPWQGHRFVLEGPDYPASWIPRDGAKRYCLSLTIRERLIGTLPPSGWEYRIPTEAQWEYGARAGTTTRFSFGDDESRLGDYACFDDKTDPFGSAGADRVGKRRPNGWGLFDMMGNLSERTLDGVVRGGNWRDWPVGCRVAARHKDRSDTNALCGFRVALVQSGE